MKKYSRVTGALCGALFMSNLFAAKIKNEDLYYQRLWPVVVYQVYKKEEKNKKQDLLQTRLIKYNNTGDIFVHLHDTGDSWKTVLNIYDIDKTRIFWTMISPPHFKDCILSPGQHSDFATIAYGNNTQNWAFWDRLYHHLTRAISFSVSPNNNPIQTLAFSPTGNSLLCRREKDTWVYNKETKQKYKWTRSGGRHAAFLNEKYMVSIGENDSMVPVYSIEKEPKTEFLPQGEIYTAQQVVLSPDEKMLAIASTYEDKERSFTQIILYDATTLKEIRKLYIPGVLFSGPREEQHENIFFSPDNKRLFMHTLTKTEGMNSWYVDVTSNSDYVRIKHSPFIKKLYELAGEYHFGGTEPRKVSIFDIRNPSRVIGLNVDNPSHLAVNPNKDSKIKAVIALADTTKLLYYTGSSTLLKDEEEKED